MILRPFTLGSGLCMAVAVAYTFGLTREVAGLERDLRDLRRDTEAVELQTHGLLAEWARLNDLDRLRALAERHLPELVPMQAAQFQRHEDAARRLPAAVAFVAPPSPFVRHEDEPAVAEAIPPPRAEPPRLAAVQPPQAARPAAAPRPAAPATAAPAVAAGIAPAITPAPQQLAAAPPVAAPRRTAPDAQPMPPTARQALPPVAAPRESAGLSPAAAAPIRPAMHVRAAEGGSMLGGHSQALAPPVPFQR